MFSVNERVFLVIAKNVPALPASAAQALLVPNVGVLLGLCSNWWPTGRESLLGRWAGTAHGIAVGFPLGSFANRAGSLPTSSVNFST